MAEYGKIHLLPNLLSEGQYDTVPVVVSKAIQGLTYFLVENVRTARRYISGLDLGLDISTLTFEVVDKNTPADRIEKLMQPLLEGVSIGVMSESGCPGVADPGARIVANAHVKGIEVIPYPGPSSLLLALMASGFNGQQFAFHGYLPIEKKARARALRELETGSRTNNQTQLFIETPYRNEQMLEAIITTCSPATRLCVARDITGEKEWIKTAPVGQWKKIKVDLRKVPTVFLMHAGTSF